jgi:BMFP domain-containing protein YqiC
MIDLQFIDEITRKLGESLPPSVTQLRDEIESKFRTVLKRSLESTDLVTREEFEEQKAVLERAQIKIQALEQQLSELEQA